MEHNSYFCLHETVFTGIPSFPFHFLPEMQYLVGTAKSETKPSTTYF